MMEYACPEEWPEIRCVMKRLYSDFIVEEIPKDGERSTTTTQNVNCEQLLKEDETNEDNKEGPNIPTEIPAEFEGISEEIKKFDLILAGELEQCQIDLKEFPKDVRKKLYQFISNSYGDKFFTICENGQLTIRKPNGRMDENRKRRYWPKERGDYLHFTMTKENMDSNFAIDQLARKLRLKPSSFSISGTKDRRAITVQRVSVYRVEQSRLEDLRFRDIWLSNFSYCNSKLRLGDACGNSFSIILRDIDPKFRETEFQDRTEKWKNHGFLNYFGAQRFGSCGVNTAEIGKLILAEKWKEAVEKLFSPRDGINDAANDCFKCFIETGNANEALSRLKSNCLNIERSLLTYLAKNPTAYKAAMLALPRDVRTMYVHAYQSLVWNAIVSKRIKNFGLKVLAGDLDENGNPLDVESACIEQVCLPLPSSDNKLPQNEVGKWYEQIAQEHDVSAESFKKIERQFAIGTVYRPFVLKPTNVAWKLLEYSGRNEILQHCDFIPKTTGETKQKDGAMEGAKSCRALKIEFDLPPGTYATTALRELLRTDFSKDAQKEIEEELRVRDLRPNEEAVNKPLE